MKYRYIPEEDILTIYVNEGKLDYAEDKDGIIIHYDKNQKPLFIEILDASRFLKKEKSTKYPQPAKV